MPRSDTSKVVKKYKAVAERIKFLKGLGELSAKLADDGEAELEGEDAFSPRSEKEDEG